MNQSKLRQLQSQMEAAQRQLWRHFEIMDRTKSSQELAVHRDALDHLARAYRVLERRLRQLRRVPRPSAN